MNGSSIVNNFYYNIYNIQREMQNCYAVLTIENMRTYC